MFAKSIVMSFGIAVHTLRPMPRAFRVQPSDLRERCALRAAACVARAHLLVASSPEGATRAHARAYAFAPAGGVRRSAVNALRRAGKMAARAALRVAYAGHPLTPTGYAILALLVAAVALVAMLSASSVSYELEPALRLGGWFS